MADHPSTPPRTRAFTNHAPQLTPEQVRRTEETRLKAKALRERDEAAARASGLAPQTRTPSGYVATTTAGQKRPHDASITTPSLSAPNQRDARRQSTTTNVTNGGTPGPSRPHDDIQPAAKFAKGFVEYDFSKMTDTKGGFLTAEDDPHNRALHHAPGGPGQPEKPAHMTLKEWERHQLLKRLREQRAGPFEPGLSVMGTRGAEGKEVVKVCRECGTREVDWKWEEVFGCLVCNACKERVPERYSLLTKTEAREDYLLTDPELKDPELLPHLERPNPHKSTWNNMQLYLRYQVEEYAFSERKWGGPEKLDEEFERREGEKKRRKEEKFRSKLVELKKRTRVEAYKRGRAGGGGGEFGDTIRGRGDKHEHEWGRTLVNAEGVGVKKCVECGMEVEELEF